MSRTVKKPGAKKQ